MIPFPKWRTKRVTLTAGDFVDLIRGYRLISWGRVPPPMDHTKELRARYF